VGVSGGRSSRTNTVIRTANTPSENILSRSGDAFGWDTGLPYRCPEMLYLRLRRDDHMLLRDAKEIVAGVRRWPNVSSLRAAPGHFLTPSLHEPPFGVASLRRSTQG
jgi:hypothetical protein